MSRGSVKKKHRDSFTVLTFTFAYNDRSVIVHKYKIYYVVAMLLFLFGRKLLEEKLYLLHRHIFTQILRNLQKMQVEMLPPQMFVWLQCKCRLK